MLFLLQICGDYFFCIFKIIYAVLAVRGICRKYLSTKEGIFLTWGENSR